MNIPIPVLDDPVSSPWPAAAPPGREEPGLAALRWGLEAFRGRIAVVSSFGADSAVLLALAAQIDRDVPVLFLDTLHHFPETRAYRHILAESLGLTDVRDVLPEPAELAPRDPRADLHESDPDACCALRKTAPLEAALAPFAAWVNGRKRFQSTTRATLPVIEQADGRTKISPLAEWDNARIAREFARRSLPRHPLVSRGFASIGCAPCTVAVAPGADPRSGRWAGTGKTECGIHNAPGHKSPARTPS